MSNLRLSDLRRSTINRKLYGVCGGIAEWLDVSPLIVRIIFIIMACLLPPFTFITYFALAFLLDKSPPITRFTRRFPGDEYAPPTESASLAFSALERRFAAIEGRLRRAEAEVTSTSFRFNRELHRAGR